VLHTQHNQIREGKRDYIFCLNKRKNTISEIAKNLKLNADLIQAVVDSEKKNVNIDQISKDKRD